MSHDSVVHLVKPKPVLTPEQSEVVNTWGRGISVIAGAGSGKTFTLVQKVRALLEKNPDARFAAVSFTEKSSRDLRDKLTELSFDLRGEGLRGHWVTTIHGLCAHVLKEFPREAGFDGTEIQLTEAESAELWQKSIELLWFEELPAEVDAALEDFLSRDSRRNLVSLLGRMRGLFSAGLFEKMQDRSLITVAEYVLFHYARTKRHEGVIDFQDLEDGARRALSHASVRNHYRKVFELVLVDEFQDTNPTQSEILSGFCREDFTNLCVVGDPKQSIYRFRDADVSVFEDFCSRLPVRVVLNRNYRSVPGVLDFCNEVCEPLFKASELNYEPLIPVKAAPATPAILHLPVKTPRDLADFLLAEKEKGADFSDMVMLLRKVRGRSETWMKTLIESGIPVAVESGGLLWTDPRAREVASLLRFWLFPKDEIVGLAFLRVPWVNVPDAWIDEWKLRKRVSLWDGFISSPHPLASLFRQSIHPGMRPGEVLSLLLRDDALCDSIGTVLLSLWHQCEELSTRGYSNLDVVQELTRRMKDGAREKGVPPPEALGQLRVMTVHGSKGLEFKRVILIDFLPRAERNMNSPLLYWDRKKGAYLVERDESGEKLKTSPDYKAWSTWEKQQALAESKRIFYVALTRAENQLIFVVPEVPPVESAIVSDTDDSTAKKPKKEKAPVDPLYVDCWRGWIEPALNRVDRPDRERLVITHRPAREAGKLKDKHSATLPSLPSFEVRRPRHSVSELLKLSLCQRQYVWGVIEEREEEAPVFLGAATEESADATYDEDPKEVEVTEDGTVRAAAEPVLPSGKTLKAEQSKKLSAREIGTRVHRALEELDRQAIAELSDEIGDGGFPSRAILSFMDEEERSRLSASKKSWNELAFEVPLQTKTGREACVGAVDRVEFDPRTGIYSVIDYKILRVRSSSENLLSRYGFQLKCYAWAVARLANVPLEKVKAELIVFFQGDVRRVPVPLGTDDFEERAERAAFLLNAFHANARRGEVANLDIPEPGAYCQRCGFLAKCEAGQKYLLENKR